MSGRQAKKGGRGPRSHGGGESDHEPIELRPDEPIRDLLDRTPVRLRIEGDLLVGYGFGHQRVEIPRSSVKSLGYYYKARYRGGPRQGLVVLDGEGRMLLRAKGSWTKKVLAFSAKAGLPTPQHRDEGRLWRRAKGYRRLRTAPRGAEPATALVVVFVLAVAMLGGMAGLFLAQLLPASFGAVRLLFYGLALIGGIIAGAVVGGHAVKYATEALKWMARLVTRSGERPPAAASTRTSPRRSRRTKSDFAQVVVLALLIFGPIVLAATLSNGIQDERLINRLRHHGVRVSGQVWDQVAVSHSTGYRRDMSVEHRIHLQFVTNGNRLVWTAEPAIDGHRYSKGPLSDATIVYDPANPETAAVAQQLRWSPWGGGRTGNLVFGSTLTVVLAAYVPFWLRRRRAR